MSNFAFPFMARIAGRPSHRSAIELRSPGISPSGCDGPLVFLAHLGEPVGVYRCAACAELLAIACGSETLIFSQPGGRPPWPTCDPRLVERLLDVARRVVSEIEDDFIDPSETSKEWIEIHRLAQSCLAVVDGKASVLPSPDLSC